MGASIWLHRSTVKDFINDLEEKVGDMFLIGDHAHPLFATYAYLEKKTGSWLQDCIASSECNIVKEFEPFEGLTVWAAGWDVPIKEPKLENYPKFLNEGYKKWKNVAEKFKNFNSFDNSRIS